MTPGPTAFHRTPGGNLGFETAPFKLSYEMTQLLDPGGTRASPTFRRFMELTCRGFLAARSVADSVVAAVAMMAPSQVGLLGQLPARGTGRAMGGQKSWPAGGPNSTAIQQHLVARPNVHGAGR